MSKIYLRLVYGETGDALAQRRSLEYTDEDDMLWQYKMSYRYWECYQRPFHIDKGYTKELVDYEP